MTDPLAGPLEPPPLETVGETFLESGHVWLHEYPDGTPFGVRLAADGRLEFAFDDRPTDADRPLRWVDADGAPPAFGFAVRFLERRFDRAALRRAVDDPTSVTVRCVAVHRRRRGYDWARAPAVVAVDVDHPGSTFLPHELARVVDALGLPALPTIDTEVHVREIPPSGVEPPETRWGEGTAFGVLYRKKGGGVARSIASQYRGAAPAAEPITGSTEAYAAEVASEATLRALVDGLDARSRPPSVATLTDAALDRALRDAYPRLTHGGTTVEVGALRSAIARRADEFLRSEPE